MNFKKHFFQSLLVSGGFNYVTQAVVFFSTVITSRLLAPETFGFVGLITVFTGFVSVFSDSGISLAVIRSDYGRTYHRSMDNLAFVMGLALCGITCLLAYPVSLFYKSGELFLPTVALSSVFILRSLTLVRSALLAKALKFAVIGRLTLATTVLQVALTVLLAYAGWSYWALIVPQIVSNFALALLYERTVKLRFRRCSLAQLKVAYRQTRKTIGNLMGFNLVNYWARNLDNLLVGKFFGVAELGLYNRAYNLLTMPLSVITGVVASILYPSLKKLKSEGGDVNKEYFFVLKMISLAAFPVSAVLVLLPKEFVLLLWGQRWLGVADLLPYFGLLVFSQSLLSTTGNVLVLMEKEHVMRISGWFSAVATVGGIAYGATVSLTAIAQFYSLAFIVVVLPFNLFYLFIRTFGFDKKDTLLFWGPVIAASVVVWAACYYQSFGWKLGGVLALLVAIVWQLRAGLLNAVQRFTVKRRMQLVPLPSKQSL